jgi:hypothetical protein
MPRLRRSSDDCRISSMARVAAPGDLMVSVTQPNSHRWSPHLGASVDSRSTSQTAIKMQLTIPTSLRFRRKLGNTRRRWARLTITDWSV